MKTQILKKRSSSLKPYALTTLMVLSYSTSQAKDDVVEEKEGKVVIEAESTSSRLGKWKSLKDLEGYSGEGYIEFTGNTPPGGDADSPLKYKFKITEGGVYYLHILCAKETLVHKGERRTDIANDCYVRVEGDYDAGPNVGDKSGDDAALKVLKKNNKFFGGKDKQFSWSSGNRLDLGGHKNKRNAVYTFKSGEEYTLVVSGRSQKFKVDQFMFSQSPKAQTAKGKKGKKK